MENSVTGLGDLLNFWQLFKVFGNNYIVQITDIFNPFLIKVLKSFIFLVK